MISEMTIEAPTEQQLVAMIHEEFDTAPQRLLQQIPEKAQMLQAEMDQLLGKASAVDPALKAKVDRLEKLGFTNTADGLLLLNQKGMDQNNRAQIRFLAKEEKDLRELTGLVAYYQETYRFATFLTLEELNRICEKYGLIHAPASTFVGEVPDKNLQEIENAQPLKAHDLPENAIQFYEGATLSVSQALQAVTNGRRASFRGETVAELLAYLERHADLFTVRGVTDNLMDSWVTQPALDEWPNIWEAHPPGRFSRFAAPFRTMPDPSYKVVEVQVPKIFSLAPITGFHIAAPPKQFKLDISRVRVVKAGKYGYVVDNDPIVFRYCRGGILVDSKWGLESSDQALINPADN